MTTRSFTEAVHVLVMVLIDGCWYVDLCTCTNIVEVPGKFEVTHIIYYYSSSVTVVTVYKGSVQFEIISNSNRGNIWIRKNTTTTQNYPFP